jgi:hypothetical protein
MEEIIGDSGFDTIGEFLRILFYNPIRGKDDPRGTAHGLAVAQFLQGKTNVKMSEIAHAERFQWSQTLNEMQDPIR